MDVIDGVGTKMITVKKIQKKHTWKSEIYPSNFIEGESNKGRVLYYM